MAAYYSRWCCELCIWRWAVRGIRSRGCRRWKNENEDSEKRTHLGPDKCHDLEDESVHSVVGKCSSDCKLLCSRRFLERSLCRNTHPDLSGVPGSSPGGGELVGTRKNTRRAKRSMADGCDCVWRRVAHDRAARSVYRAGPIGFRRDEWNRGVAKSGGVPPSPSPHIS